MHAGFASSRASAAIGRLLEFQAQRWGLVVCRERERELERDRDVCVYIYAYVYIHQYRESE